MEVSPALTEQQQQLIASLQSLVTDLQYERPDHQLQAFLSPAGGDGSAAALSASSSASSSSSWALRRRCTSLASQHVLRVRIVGADPRHLPPGWSTTIVQKLTAE